MEALVLLSVWLKKDAIQDIFEKLEPFANIHEGDGIIYYRTIIIFKVLFVLHAIKTVLPKKLTQCLLLSGSVYIASMKPEIAILGAISLLLQILSHMFIKRNRWVSYVIMVSMGVISLNIKPLEFVLDAYAFFSLLWYAIQTYRKEIQKLCSVILLALTVSWYVKKECTKNLLEYNKCIAIFTCLVLAFAPLRPNRSNRHRNRLFYFYALMFMWLLYQYHHLSSPGVHVINMNKNISDACCTLSADSMSHNFHSGKHTLSSQNYFCAEKVSDDTCLEGFNSSVKNSELMKDGSFSVNRIPNKHSKDVDSVEAFETSKIDNKLGCEENRVQKSVLNNSDCVNENVVKMDKEDKHTMQPILSAMTSEKYEQSLESSESNVEKTSREIKDIFRDEKKQFQEGYQIQDEDKDLNSDDTSNSETIQAEIRKVKHDQKTEVATDVDQVMNSHISTHETIEAEIKKVKHVQKTVKFTTDVDQDMNSHISTDETIEAEIGKVKHVQKTVKVTTDASAYHEESELHQNYDEYFANEIEGVPKKSEEFQTPKVIMNDGEPSYVGQVPEFNGLHFKKSNSQEHVDDEKLKSGWKEEKSKLENTNAMEDANVDEEMLADSFAEKSERADVAKNFNTVNKELEQNEESKNEGSRSKDDNGHYKQKEPKIVENIMNLISSNIDVVDSIPKNLKGKKRNNLIIN